MTERVWSKLYPGQYYEWDWDFGELCRYASGPDGGIVVSICVGPEPGFLYGWRECDYAILRAATVMEWVRVDEQYVLDTGNWL